MCYNIGIKGKGGSTQNIYYLGKETMNEVRLTPKRMQEDKERIMRLIKNCQRIAIVCTLSSWIVFFIFAESDSSCSSSFIWPPLVVFQWVVLDGFLENAIKPIILENEYVKLEIKQLPKIKWIGVFVVCATIVLLLRDILVMQQPVKDLVVHLLFIVIFAKMVYNATSFPIGFTV